MRLPTPTDPPLTAVCALVHANPRTLAALSAATEWRTQSRLYHALRLLADDIPFRRHLGYTPGTHHRRPYNHGPAQRRQLPSG